MKKVFKYISILTVLFASFMMNSCANTPASSSSELNNVEKYNIYVTDNPNVEVEVAKQASPGDEVKIKVQTNEGYYLQSVKVNDEIIYFDTFVMPRCDVLIDVSVITGKEVYPVNSVDNEYGIIYPLVENARNGEEVKVKVFANEGYRLEALYANGVNIPFVVEDYGYASATIMQNKELVFTAEFKEIEKISNDYDFTLKSSNPNNPAVSYWKATYGDDGITFSVLVEDKTIVNTASIAMYNNDNIEFQICKSTNLSAMDQANGYRCLVNVAGRYLFQKANGVDTSLDHSSVGVNLLYGENFVADSTLCTEKQNGFDGYAIEVYIGYSLLNLTFEEAYGNLTFAPALRDSVKYDYSTSQLTTYWDSTSYNHNRSNGDRFFNDDRYRCDWSDPATFLGISKNNQIYSRFDEVYKNVDYMFLGDSYLNPTYWGTYKEDTNDIFSLNFGFSGSYASDWNKIAWLNTVGSLTPKNIVVHIGLNDFNVGLKNETYSTRVSETESRIKTLIENLHAYSPNSKLYWITMEPNELHKTEISYYDQINSSMMTYGEGKDYLTIIDTSKVMLTNGQVVSSLYLADKLHMSSFGYARWVNTVKSALNLNKFSSEVFGNAETGWSTCGWEEKVVDNETILSHTGTSSRNTDKYMFFKNVYASDLTASASFNISKVYNGDCWPKFGFILDDGTNQVLIFIGTDSKMRQKSVGYVTRTPSSDGKGASLNWSEGKETNINCYFNGEDYASLKIEKIGAKLKVVINEYELYSIDLQVCTQHVSVGVFTFNTQLNVKAAKVEVK